MYFLLKANKRLVIGISDENFSMRYILNFLQEEDRENCCPSIGGQNFLCLFSLLNMSNYDSGIAQKLLQVKIC